MTVHYRDDDVTVHHGDCLDVLAELADASVDAVVTDPPYGISFMGKQWDQPGQFGSRRRATGINPRRGHKDAALEAGKYDLSPAAMLNFQRWCTAWSAECLRILRPGGHMLAFGGSRTWHRLAGGIEDAGFEIRDSIAWLYGSGFPKSLDVSKAIDRAAGAEREVPEMPSTDEAAQWAGWGTALKPSFEPIVVGRKALAGTVAANIAEHGTGALNIDGCRTGAGGHLKWSRPRGLGYNGAIDHGGDATANELGRWPSNVVLDEQQAAALDAQSGISRDGVAVNRNRDIGADRTNNIYGRRKVHNGIDTGYGGEGGASRFFPVFRYNAKAPGTERPNVDGTAHPTVKPLDLMRWLVRLVTPPGGLVLDPFAGSGTTAEACIQEHMRCITIEREADYLPLIVARLSKPMAVGFDFGGES